MIRRDTTHYAQRRAKPKAALHHANPPRHPFRTARVDQALGFPVEKQCQRISDGILWSIVRTAERYPGFIRSQPNGEAFDQTCLHFMKIHGDRFLFFLDACREVLGWRIDIRRHLLPHETPDQLAYGLMTDLSKTQDALFFDQQNPEIDVTVETLDAIPKINDLVRISAQEMQNALSSRFCHGGFAVDIGVKESPQTPELMRRWNNPGSGLVRIPNCGETQLDLLNELAFSMFGVTTKINADTTHLVATAAKGLHHALTTQVGEKTQPNVNEDFSHVVIKQKGGAQILLDAFVITQKRQTAQLRPWLRYFSTEFLRTGLLQEEANLGPLRMHWNGYDSPMDRLAGNMIVAEGQRVLSLRGWDGAFFRCPGANASLEFLEELT